MSFPDFSRFFETCNGAAPYRWQTRLARQVLSDRKWPEALDLPTGSGKTSVIDIALYVLAAAAHEGEIGVFPRRIFLVVDRRVLVDQAWRHGRRLLERVETATELAPVRQALASLSPDAASSIRLRGACPTDPQWCRSADQVQIVASTVDQIGSRLLMRGYGVTPRMRSVEAGLVGQDAIIFLDEAHLAGPLLSTLFHLERLEPVRGMAPKRQVVQLSATPGATAGKTRFPLRKEDYQDAALGLRLNARKTVRWSEDKIERILPTVDVACVLLVANTVRTALDWFKVATARTGCKESASEREIYLVTGRMRPLDRQAVLDKIEDRLDRRAPTLVVATQCVEAGVDWDFDAMVSECASWDSLVQRMGRVNRRGERDDVQCVVLKAQRTFTEPESEEKICPVYRRYEVETAKWLARRSRMECTPGSMPEAPKDCSRPPASGPLLIPEYLDLWSQNRTDGPACDVSVFLHGVQEEDRRVQVIWRDFLDPDDGACLERLLSALPPSSLEAVSVPIGELREWLGKRKVIRLGTEPAAQPAEQSEVGETLVIPAEYGGIGPHCTFDRSTGRVPDISSEALREHRDLEFQFHGAPPVEEDAPIEEQVDAWIAEDDSRSALRDWTWIDAGPCRWLFVSKLPVDNDDDGSAFRQRRGSLERHLNGVSERTRRTAERLGLPRTLADDLVLWARLHDLGKLDDRIQRLYGRAPGEEALAASGHNWIERRRRAAMSDYPAGERHEALSVELMIRHGLHDGANDPELVEHLVASHHGWSRPFMRAAQGTARVHDRLFDLDFQTELEHTESERAPARFRAVQERFGWLGLAWLEAVVQLNDHRQSCAEDRGEPGPASGASLESRRSEVHRTTPPPEIVLTTLNGLVPGDYLAALGVLRSLHLAGGQVLLRWTGTQPRIRTNLGIDGIVNALVDVRDNFSGVWPAELNKLSNDQCDVLLLGADGPFRSVAVALISSGGRSEMDFVSGGRSSFKSVFEWATTPKRKEFSSEALRRTFVGPRELTKGGKSFRWSPLAAQGARRPQNASNDKRSEPWIEWLSLMGVSALVSVPEVRRGRLATRSTAVRGRRWNGKQFRWPLWRAALAWPEVMAAVASTRSGLRDALWCETRRIPFGPQRNRTYGFGPGQLLP